MSQAQVKKSTNWVGILTIPVALVVSILVFIFIFGDADNFNADHSPKAGNYFGTIHEGGFVVPLLMTLFLTVFTIVIERLFTISSAKGRGSLEGFLQKVKT